MEVFAQYSNKELFIGLTVFCLLLALIVPKLNRPINIALIIAASAAVIYITWLSRTISTGVRVHLMPFYFLQRCSFYHWKYEKIKTIILQAYYNFLMLMPVGSLLYGVIAPYGRNHTLTGCAYAFLTGFTFSFLIEMVQYIASIGYFETDDLMMNTAGCLVGFILTCVSDRYIFRRRM